ncbi:MAG: hypothetical protein ACKOWH_01385, partial [Rhodoluna sp.]
FAGDILTLKFQSNKDLESFKTAAGASDILRNAINEVLGVQVRFKAEISETPAPAEPAQKQPETKPIEKLEPEPGEIAEPVAAVVAAPVEKTRKSPMVDESTRYGESLLREMLGAEPIADKNGGK